MKAFTGVNISFVVFFVFLEMFNLFSVFADVLSQTDLEVESINLNFSSQVSNFTLN